jgi:hypothetical protein
MHALCTTRTFSSSSDTPRALARRLLYPVIVLRLVVPVLFAACVAPGLSTYNDTDPAIENGGSGGGACTATAFTVTPVTPYIQLVVDGSGTMFTENLGGTQKYQAVHDALVKTGAGLLNTLQSKALFGASMYTSDACPKLFAAPCTLNNVAGISTALTDGANNGNHLYDPLDKAITAVATTLAAAPAGSKKVIIVATDGVSNSCTSQGDNATSAVTAATTAYTNQISTYIIGLGNADGDGNWGSFQTNMANAGVGGTGTTYNVTSPATLATAYTTIFNTVLDCELTLDGTIDVAQASLGTVKLNGTTLVYTTDWTAVDEHTIKLVGQKCIDYNSAATAPEITATFTCGSSLM